MPDKIVFLHAVGQSAASWKRQLEAFPGSVAPALDAGTVEAMARQAAHHGPAHFVGLSMGGVVALELFRQSPTLVRSLTLACAWSKHPQGRERIEFLEESLAKRTLREWASDSRPFLLSPCASEEVARQVFEIEAAKEPWLYRRQWRSIFSADLSGIVPTVPTLLLGASLDRLTPVATCLEPLLRQIPGSKLVVVPNANHFLNQDRPEEFNRLIAEFLGWK